MSPKPFPCLVVTPCIGTGGLQVLSSGDCDLPLRGCRLEEVPGRRQRAEWSPWVVTPASCPPTRLTHDISLEEFEDEDLSEITDECGISLQCKDALSLRVRVGPQEPKWGGRMGRDRVEGTPTSTKGLSGSPWHPHS